MGTATLTLAYLMMAAGGTPDVWPINQSNIRIPIHIDPVRRPLIKQLVLYASSDEGRTWKQVAVAAPEQDAFAFSAPTEGDELDALVALSNAVGADGSLTQPERLRKLTLLAMRTIWTSEVALREDRH